MKPQNGIDLIVRKRVFPKVAAVGDTAVPTIQEKVLFIVE